MTNIEFSSFQQQIEQSSGKKLKLKINDNRSTMLSVKWEPDCTIVSMHRMFLNAPENVMQSLVCYIGKKQKAISTPVKAFISEKLKTLDYTHVLSQQNLQHEGDIYNLKNIYESLNKEYFGNGLNLNITWYGTRKNRNRSRITFGLYCDTMKLIKVSRQMDAHKFPDYVVSYVIYHEMLHHICPPYIKDGFNSIHNVEFKKRETEFKYFREVKQWFKANRHALFA